MEAVSPLEAVSNYRIEVTHMEILGPPKMLVGCEVASAFGCRFFFC